MWILLVVCSLLLASPVWSANTYYVDKENRGGPCSNTYTQAQAQNNPAKPRCSITEGRKLLAGGDTLIIRGGVYAENINPPGPNVAPSAGGFPNGLGTWATATKIVGAAGETAVLRPPCGAFGSVVVKFGEGGDFHWIIVDNLELDSSDVACGHQLGETPGGNGTQVGGDSHHIRFSNCNIHGSGNTQTGTLTGGGGTFHEYINNKLHDTGGYGSYWSGSNSLFEGNEWYNIGGYAMHMYNTPGPGVPPQSVNDNVFRNNRVYNNGFRYFPGSVLISHGFRNLVYNNLVYNNADGIQIFDACKDCAVYNNTIVHNGYDHGGGDRGGFGVKVGSDEPANEAPTGTIVRNNILVGNVVAPTVVRIYNTGTPAVTWSHNLCLSSAANCAVEGDPQFVDINATPADFHLKPTSAARNKGMSLSSIFTSSYYGTQRPQGPALLWDIGADVVVEGGGVPPSRNPIYVAKTGSDSNDCLAAESQGTPKLTILSALTCMTVPGKILYIKAGTYSEVIDTVVTPITGGNGPSYSDATTIEGFGSDVVTIQVPVGGFLPLWMRNAARDHYIIFRKLIFDSANRTNSNGPSLATGVHHIRFENVEVKNSVFETFYVQGANNIELSHVSVHHSSAGFAAVILDGTLDGFSCQNCDISAAGGAGIDWTPAGTKTNIVIRESTVHNNTGAGIHVGASAGAVIQNSFVAGNGSIGIHIHGGATGARLYNNTVYNNVPTGVQCDSGATGIEIKNTLATHSSINLINNCGATTATNIETDSGVIYVNAPTDVHLADGSAGINAGTKALMGFIQNACKIRS